MTTAAHAVVDIAYFAVADTPLSTPPGALVVSTSTTVEPSTCGGCGDTVPDTVGVTDPVPDGVSVCEGVCDSDEPCDGVCDGVAEFDGVCDGDGGTAV